MNGWSSSWLLTDLVAASEDYFERRQRANRRTLLVSAFMVCCCLLTGWGGTWLCRWSSWLGIPVLIFACGAGFLPLALTLAAGTQYAVDSERRNNSLWKERLLARDDWPEVEALLQRGAPFVLYLRNFRNEEADPAPMNIDFAPPVDIHDLRTDNRLEAFALAHCRELPVVTLGFVASDFVDSSCLEVFLGQKDWRDAFEWLAQRASLIISVVDESTSGVKRECETLVSLAAQGTTPPIWLVLRDRLRKEGWATELETYATWVTAYDGLPTGAPPEGVRLRVASIAAAIQNAQQAADEPNSA